MRSVRALLCGAEFVNPDDVERGDCPGLAHSSCLDISFDTDKSPTLVGRHFACHSDHLFAMLTRCTVPGLTPQESIAWHGESLALVLAREVCPDMAVVSFSFTLNILLSWRCAEPRGDATTRALVQLRSFSCG